MRYRLLELICCPECGGDLALETGTTARRSADLGDATMPRCRERCTRHCMPAAAVKEDECRACYREEVVDGTLHCTAGHAFPVIGGIPRLLVGPLLDEAVGRAATANGETAKKLATLRAFGYQWTTFVDNFDYFRDIFLSFIRPFLTAEDFAGKLVLEVGCGSGRPASVAASFGAEVVAMDLSHAVETAYGMSTHYPLLHVVQGDAYRLPFKAHFDFVYSVGVIQHLPDPAKAFRSIAKVVAPGQRLVVWVYGIREAWYQPIEWLRKLTTRLPFRVVRALSYLLAVMSEIFLLLPYRLMRRVSFLSGLAERIPGRIYALLPFRENVLGWFDRLIAPVTFYFSRDDVVRMMSDAGFKGVEVAARPSASASWVAQGYKT